MVLAELAIVREQSMLRLLARMWSGLIPNPTSAQNPFNLLNQQLSARPLMPTPAWGLMGQYPYASYEQSVAWTTAQQCLSGQRTTATLLTTTVQQQQAQTIHSSPLGTNCTLVQPPPPPPPPLLPPPPPLTRAPHSASSAVPQEDVIPTQSLSEFWEAVNPFSFGDSVSFYRSFSALPSRVERSALSGKTQTQLGEKTAAASTIASPAKLLKPQSASPAHSHCDAENVPVGKPNDEACAETPEGLDRKLPEGANCGSLTGSGTKRRREESTTCTSETDEDNEDAIEIHDIASVSSCEIQVASELSDTIVLDGDDVQVVDSPDVAVGSPVNSSDDSTPKQARFCLELARPRMATPLMVEDVSCVDLTDLTGTPTTRGRAREGLYNPPPDTSPDIQIIEQDTPAMFAGRRQQAGQGPLGGDCGARHSQPPGSSSSGDRSGHQSPMPTDLESKLLHRPWNYNQLGKEFQTRVKRGYQPFTIASYNVLAQNLLEDNHYLYARSRLEDLTWENRSQHLLREITQHQPDILCMQEIYQDHYESFFRPELAKLGYNGTYKKRSGDKHDGCSTFYKRDKFILHRVFPVNYYKPGVPVLDRDNVGLVVLLKPVTPRYEDSRLCVANTHLLFNPRRGEIKLAQLMVLLAEIDRVAYRAESAPWKPHYHPTLVCGDFNSEPFCDIYKLLERGMLRYEGLCSRHMSGQEEGRRGGRDNYLTKELLPDSLGITDTCVFLDVFEQRVQEYQAWKASKALKSHPKKMAKRSQQDAPNSSGRPPPQESNSTSTSVWMKTESDKAFCGASKSRGESMDEQEEGELAETDGVASPSAQETQSPGAVLPASRLEPSVDPAARHAAQGSGRASHKLNLQSVYTPRGHQVREVTTNHLRANCMVDYIFHSVPRSLRRDSPGRRRTPIRGQEEDKGRLRLLGSLQLLSDADMSELGGLPNAVVGSDHLMLMAKFLWKLKK